MTYRSSKSFFIFRFFYKIIQFYLVFGVTTYATYAGFRHLSVPSSRIVTPCYGGTVHMGLELMNM